MIPLSPGQVVMHMPRQKLVRVVGLIPWEDVKVTDILTSVQMIVPESSLGPDVYEEDEVVAWATNQQ